MGKWFGNLNNRIEEGKVFAEVTIGTGATEYMWSDRLAYTVVKIVDKRHIIVRRDNATRNDSNGMSDAQSWVYETEEKIEYPKDFDFIGVSDRREKDIKKYNLGKNEILLTLSKNGKWKEMGSTSGWSIGVRNEYYDYSF